MVANMGEQAKGFGPGVRRYSAGEIVARAKDRWGPAWETMTVRDLVDFLRHAQAHENPAALEGCYECGTIATTRPALRRKHRRALVRSGTE